MKQAKFVSGSKSTHSEV